MKRRPQALEGPHLRRDLGIVLMVAPACALALVPIRDDLVALIAVAIFLVLVMALALVGLAYLHVLRMAAGGPSAAAVSDTAEAIIEDGLARLEALANRDAEPAPADPPAPVERSAEQRADPLAELRSVMGITDADLELTDDDP